MTKRAFLVFALLFLAVNSYAHEVYIAYVADKACSTNMVFNVEDGNGFQFYGTIPNGYDLESFRYVGAPPQVNRVCKTLFVGINDYLPSRQLKSLTTCVNDAETMSALLVQGGYYQGKDGYLLENEGALKSNIRACVANAASELIAGDVFVYYHSSHGGNDPAVSLCTYDSNYYAAELAADLSKFQAGVRVVVILDTCFSGGMIPTTSMSQAVISEMAEIRAKSKGLSIAEAEADVQKDVTFLTACRGDEESYTSKVMLSIFTRCLYNGCDAMSDLDGDGMLSFYEIFERALAYLATGSVDQHPVISNPELANSVYAMPIPQPSCFGSFVFKADRFAFVVPAVKQSLYIELKALPKKQPFEVTQFNLKTNLKKAADLSDPLPNKFDMAFKLGTVPEDAKTPVTLNGADMSININGLIIPIAQTGQSIKTNKKKTNVTIGLVNYYFETMGKLQYKVNEKKGISTYKLKIAGENGLHTMFDPTSAVQTTHVFLRGPQCVRANIDCKTVMKEGKSFTAKLTKEDK